MQAGMHKSGMSLTSFRLEVDTQFGLTPPGQGLIVLRDKCQRLRKLQMSSESPPI